MTPSNKEFLNITLPNEMPKILAACNETLLNKYRQKHQKEYQSLLQLQLQVQNNFTSLLHVTSLILGINAIDAFEGLDISKAPKIRETLIQRLSKNHKIHLPKRTPLELL